MPPACPFLPLLWGKKGQTTRSKKVLETHISISYNNSTENWVKHTQITVCLISVIYFDIVEQFSQYYSKTSNWTFKPRPTLHIRIPSLQCSRKCNNIVIMYGIECNYLIITNIINLYGVTRITDNNGFQQDIKIIIYTNLSLQLISLALNHLLIVYA